MGTEKLPLHVEAVKGADRDRGNVLPFRPAPRRFDELVAFQARAAELVFDEGSTDEEQEARAWGDRPGRCVTVPVVGRSS